MDYAYANINYERMRRAMILLDENPKTYEHHRDNEPGKKEYVLQGTQLRDVLLRSFSPDELAQHEPHHLQNPEEESYPAHEVLEHPSRLNSGGGAFSDDCRIRSWARRYAKDNPVVVEGDPVLEGLNASQVKAAATMIGERISLIQGVSI
jgi:hypothetical protein